MLKISTKHSTTLSIAISVVFLIGCVVCIFLTPSYSRVLMNLYDQILSESSRAPLIADDVLRSGLVIALGYSIVAVCVLADLLLFRLLLLVRQEKVFTEKSVALIRGVSWCCFLLGLAFCGLGMYFQLSFLVAFAAVFLGMCLRVVKNTIEEATQIKSENDLTV